MNVCPKCGTRAVPLYVKRLRQIRKAKGLSQEDVAEHLGCSHALVSRLEAGGSEPMNAVRKKWREFLVDGPSERTPFYG